MSYLSSFLKEPKTVKLSDGRELVLKPLAVRHIKLILRATEGEKVNPEGMEALVRTVLKESYPDATNDELDNFPFEVVAEILGEIFAMNTLPKGADELGREAIMERLRKKHENMAESRN